MALSQDGQPERRPTGEDGGGTPANTSEVNVTLERESHGCSSILFYMFIFLMLDVWKQVASYGMKYYNDDHYPVPQTQVVALTECLKLSIFFFSLLFTKEIKKVKLSPWYALPSIIYAINNNIYYFALNYVTPPIWNIIIQLRVLFTALAYRCYFKRHVSVLQWVALSLLVLSIILTNLTGGNKLHGKNNFMVALVLAGLGSVLSVIGTVFMEYLFKNDRRPFAEMQFQLYLFSGIVAWSFYVIEVYSTAQHNISAAGNISWTLVLTMVVACILLSATSGIVVAFIVKKLDNIVKLYSQALSNMLTSIACALLFPNHFQISLLFVLCLLLMFAAIFLYENQNIDVGAIKAYISSNRYRLPVIFVIVLIIVAVVSLMGSYIAHKYFSTTSDRVSIN